MHKSWHTKRKGKRKHGEEGERANPLQEKAHSRGQGKQITDTSEEPRTLNPLLCKLQRNPPQNQSRPLRVRSSPHLQLVAPTKPRQVCNTDAWLVLSRSYPDKELRARLLQVQQLLSIRPRNLRDVKSGVQALADAVQNWQAQQHPRSGGNTTEGKELGTLPPHGVFLQHFCLRKSKAVAPGSGLRALESWAPSNFLKDP